ncbi:MAG: hypothetical protein JKY94_01010 [Rhodobacteraceae bacterium]|nr:hypothetical protein [Paracoccaceae bacterium]
MSRSRNAFVSDHAVLRYLERIKGVDIDAVREAILTDSVKVVATVGRGRVKTEKFVAIVREGTVVTVYER